MICENTMSGQNKIDPSDSAAEAMQALFELFSKRANPFKGRTYILEDIEGQLVFRRDEIDLIVGEAVDQAYGKVEGRGDEIVPEKLAKLFPGPSSLR